MGHPLRHRNNRLHWRGAMQVLAGALFLGGAIPGLLIGLCPCGEGFRIRQGLCYPITAHPALASASSAIKGAALAMLNPDPDDRRHPDHHQPWYGPDTIGASVGIDPFTLVTIDIILGAFGLVTLPYGLCLLIPESICGMNEIQFMRDEAVIRVPMMIILILLILFPDIALLLHQTLTPRSFP